MLRRGGLPEHVLDDNPPAFFPEARRLARERRPKTFPGALQVEIRRLGYAGDMRTALLLGPLALGLSACTLNVQTTAGLSGARSNLIGSFQPGRGEGSTYQVGEQVSFTFSTRVPGYLTLVSLDPTGYSNVLIRGAAVSAGTTTFPRAEDGVSYTVSEPRGLQRVRAIFTRVRPSAEIALQGSYTGDTWNTATNSYIRPYALNDRDVQETFFYIR